MDKKTLLKNIVKSCEARFNRGASENWKHSDFSDFSREILKETKVNISTNTLKRIFGKIVVDDYYLPQQATINALKNYSNYIYHEADNDSEVIQSKTTVATNLIFLKKHHFLWAISIIFLITCGLYFFTKNKENNLGLIKLVNTEGLLPKTAFFDIKVPDSEDSVFVDFGDKSPLIYLKPEYKKISHAYLFPGNFKVSFKISDSIFNKTKVYIPSNKWLGLGYYKQQDIPNSYYAFPALKTGKDSLFHIPNIQLHKAGLDTLNSYYTRLCNFTPIKNYSDNFIFETTFKKAISQKGIYCSGMQFQISGIENIIRFNFVSSGCSSRVMNFISEQIISGTKSDLSQFVLNLDQWNTAKLVNRNKKLSLFVNNKLLFQGNYKESLGDLRGVFVEFRGNGYVKKCSLTSLDGKILYRF